VFGLIIVWDVILHLSGEVTRRCLQWCRANARKETGIQRWKSSWILFFRHAPYVWQRTRDETQPNLGRETTESGTRHDRIWDGRRPNLGRETTESGARGADKLRERGAEDYLTLQR